MQIEWTARGTHVPDHLQSKVEQHINRLERYLHGHSAARVVVVQQGDDGAHARRTIEIIVHNKLGTFTARDESHDLRESATSVLNRLEAQVRRAHDKRLDARRRGEAAMIGIDSDEER